MTPLSSPAELNPASDNAFSINPAAIVIGRSPDYKSDHGADRRAAQQRFGIANLGDLCRPGALVDSEEPRERGNRRKVIDRLVGEPARQRLDRGHAIPVPDRLSGFTI